MTFFLSQDIVAGGWSDSTEGALHVAGLGSILGILYDPRSQPGTIHE